MNVRAAVPSDRDWAASVVARHFGTAEIISRGVRNDTRWPPGLILEEAGEKGGLLFDEIEYEHSVLGFRADGD